VSFLKHSAEKNIVFLQEVSHCPRERMQELANKGEVIDRKTENIYNKILALYLSKLVYRFC
jgi:hypothetical protein